MFKSMRDVAAETELVRTVRENAQCSLMEAKDAVLRYTIDKALEGVRDKKDLWPLVDIIELLLNRTIKVDERVNEALERSLCECATECSRWRFSLDRTTGYFCPNIPGGGTVCKQTILKTMKPTIDKSLPSGDVMFVDVDVDKLPLDNQKDLTGQLYHIWSNSSGMWWRSDFSGYTHDLNQAGKYTEEQTYVICPSLKTGERWSQRKDVPVRTQCATTWAKDRTEL